MGLTSFVAVILKVRYIYFHYQFIYQNVEQFVMQFNLLTQSISSLLSESEIVIA